VRHNSPGGRARHGNSEGPQKSDDDNQTSSKIAEGAD